MSLLCVTLFISILQYSHSHNAPQDYVNAHNEARKELGLGPMQWDSTVAKFAESYAHQRKADCALVHSRYGKYGENLAIGYGYGEFSGLEAVKLWVDEKAHYDYESNTCSKMCGHYTQIVWKTSTRLGCARVKCMNRNAWFVTCNYDPPGNYIGKKPY